MQDHHPETTYSIDKAASSFVRKSLKCFKPIFTETGQRKSLEDYSSEVVSNQKQAKPKRLSSFGSKSTTTN